MMRIEFDIDWIEEPIPATDRELAQVEAHFGHQLPEDYRVFAKRYAGGEPRRTDFSFKDGGQEFYGGVGIFLNLQADDEYGVIPTAEITEGFPENLIPIGEDGGGNYIALNYRSGESPNIVFWHHGRSDDEDQVSPVCGTFTEFLNMLKEPEDEF